MTHAVIVDAVRTPSGRGKPGGALSSVHSIDLLAHVLRALVDRSGVDPELIDDVIGGCVQQVGEQSTNLTRSAVLAAGWPHSVPATTIDRQCGSSQQAISFAAQAVMAGVQDIVVACGVESMSRVPMGTGAGESDTSGDALRSRYPHGLVHQGIAAELIAAKWGLSRRELDEYAARSHDRASRAATTGLFDDEIAPVPLSDDRGEWHHAVDETVRPQTTIERLSGLPSAFHSEAMSERFGHLEWNITAGNSSPYTDGASAVLIMSEVRAHELGLRPRARFVSFSVLGDDPVMMLTAPIPATKRVLQRSGLTIEDIDAYEVNEAFASIPLAWARELRADEERLNPRGGAIALGHPLGASGARLMTTLVNHLEATGGRYGLQTMCEGGGLANATIIERI